MASSRTRPSEMHDIESYDHPHPLVLKWWHQAFSMQPTESKFAGILNTNAENSHVIIAVGIASLNLLEWQISYLLYVSTCL